MQDYRWRPLEGAHGQENADAALAAPFFPVIGAEEIGVSNAWHAARGVFAVSDPRLPLWFASGFSHEADPAEPLAALNFTIAGSLAQLLAPRALLFRIIAEYGLDGSSLQPQLLLLLLEHRLSALIGTIESELGAPIILHDLLPSGAEALEGRFALSACCGIGQERYRMKLFLTHALAQRCAKGLASLPAPMAPVMDVTVTMAIRVGWSELTYDELASVRLNDVLLVNSPLGPSQALAIFGERYGARAELKDGGASLLESPSPLSEDHRKAWSMTETANDAPQTQVDGQLDDILIKLTFELGRKDMELGLLKSVAEGHVFDLGRDPRIAVDILAGSRRIGQGELVRISQALGVRVTRLFTHE